MKFYTSTSRMGARMTLQEIADVMGVTQGCVSMALQSGFTKIRRHPLYPEILKLSRELNKASDKRELL
jgi:predicted transcriptional regulator